MPYGPRKYARSAHPGLLITIQDFWRKASASSVRFIGNGGFGGKGVVAFAGCAFTDAFMADAMSGGFAFGLSGRDEVMKKPTEVEAAR